MAGISTETWANCFSHLQSDFSHDKLLDKGRPELMRFQWIQFTVRTANVASADKCPKPMGAPIQSAWNADTFISCQKQFQQPAFFPQSCCALLQFLNCANDQFIGKHFVNNRLTFHGFGQQHLKVCRKIARLVQATAFDRQHLANSKSCLALDDNAAFR